MGMVRLVDMAVLVLLERRVISGLFAGRRAGCCALFVGFFDRGFSDFLLGVLCRQVFRCLIRLRARYDWLESDVFGLHAYELEQQQRKDEGDRCFNIEGERKGERVDQPTRQDRDEDSSHAASHRSDARDRTYFAAKPVADQIGGCHHTAKTVPDACKRAGHAQARQAIGSSEQEERERGEERGDEESDARIEATEIHTGEEHADERHEGAYGHHHRSAHIADPRNIHDIGLVDGKRRGREAGVHEEQREGARYDDGLVMLLDSHF